jgi:hypothetical protein
MKTLLKYFKTTGRINTFMTTNADLDISNYIDDIFDALIIENFSESIVSFDDYYVKNGKLMPLLKHQIQKKQFQFMMLLAILLKQHLVEL